MSAHHYFRNFAYCDSGMIPWLLVAEAISISAKSLADLVDERIARYPCSGEINFRVANAKETISRIESFYAPNRPVIDRTDGLSLEFENWRMNLRASNTEPLLRLNIETRGDPDLLDEQVKELEQLIGAS
jgi:phosphomannomutase